MTIWKGEYLEEKIEKKFNGRKFALLSRNSIISATLLLIILYMKKILLLTICIFSVFFSQFTFAETIEENAKAPIKIEAATANGEKAEVTVKEVPIEKSDIQERFSYTYYYGESCIYCIQLDEFLKKHDGYNKLDIVKKEIWKNKENAAEMTKEVKRLWLDITKIWTPFIVVKGKQTEFTLNDMTQAKDHFANVLGVENTDKVTELTQKKDYSFIILAVLWIIVVAASAFFIKLSNKK